MSDMITITIDGKVIETKSSNTILQAAKEHGIYIPTLCWHEDLAPTSNTA